VIKEGIVLKLGDKDMEENSKYAMSGTPVLLVTLTEDGHMAFVGFPRLSVLLREGAELEKYLTQKIAQARKALVVAN
jgi:hypothetical protein